MIKSLLKLKLNHRKAFITLTLILFFLLTLFFTPSSGYAGYSPVTNIDNGADNYSAQLDAYQRDIVYVKPKGESVWTGTGYVYTYIGDVYLYQKSTGSAVSLTSPAADADQRHPSIWGNRIVWQDGRNDANPKYPNGGGGNYDIYLNEIGGSTYQLTTSSAKQIEPDIFGNYVVWLDNRNGGGFDVYLYDLSVDTDGDTIPNYKDVDRPNPDPAERRLTSSASVYNSEPKVYGHRVVWFQSSSPNAKVYSYDIDSSTQTQLASGILGNHPFASIYRDMVIWLENSGSDVYKYDFNSPGRTHILTSPWPLTTPSLWGNNFAAEADNSDVDWDVRIYNLSGVLLWERTAGADSTFEKNPTLFGDPGAGTGLVAWAQDTIYPDSFDNNIKAAGLSDNDTTPPSPPTSAVAADAGNAALSITWTHSASADTAGYKLYWGTSPGVYTNSVDVFDINAYKLTGLTYGQTYYLALKAYDTSNLSSGYSSETSAAATNTPPETIISDPTGATTLTTSPTLITGTATDTVAVDAVEVSIKRQSDGYWWNGSAWVSGQNWLSATITAGQHTPSVLWGYSWDLPASDGNSYIIYARAEDDVPAYDATPAQVTVAVDNVAPTGSILINNGDAYATTSAVTLNLNASDSGGVAGMRFSNDNLVWSTWESYGVTKSFNLLSGDGTQTAYVQYRDGLLNESTVYNDTIFVDSVAPASFISALGDYITTDTVALAWNGVDSAPASGPAAYDIQSRFENGPWTDWTTNTVQINGTFTAANGEGHYDWRIRSRDNAGNQESYRTLPDETITVDWTSPTDPTSFTSSTDSTGTWLNHNQITLNWSDDATDNISGVDGYSIDWDNSSTPTDPPAKNVNNGQTTTTSPVLTDGNNWWAHLRTVDKAGNWTSTKNIGPFWVDTGPPTTTLGSTPSAPDGENSWYKTAPLITLSSTESGDTYYSWDSTLSMTTYTATFTAPEGNHTLYYYSVDTANNTETVKYQLFKVDTVKPTDPTSITSPSHIVNVWSNNNTVNINFSGAGDGVFGSGLAGYSVSWSQGGIAVPDTTVDLSPTAISDVASLADNGAWYFNLRTKDVAGNWTSTVHLGPFKIDTTAPNAFALSAPANNSWQGSNSPNFSWNPSSDSGSGLAKYQLWIDNALNKDNLSATQAYPASGLGNGSHSWYVKAIDNMGNSRNSNTYTVKIDTTAPNAFALSAPANNSWQGSNSPNFSWNPSSDSGSGLAKYQLWIDNALNKDNLSATQAYPASGLGNGSHSWYVKAIDNMGNSRNSNTYTVKIDTTAPNNPTAASETGGAQNNVLQNSVANPNFTWSGATDSGSGIVGYYYYFGTNSNGTASNWTTSAAYNPTAVSPGTYYLRVRTKDNVGNLSNWQTIFTFKYKAPVFSKIQSWYSGPGGWDAANNKLAAGDFNHDGYQDIVSFYNYPTTRQVRAWVWLNDGSGNYLAPQIWWDSGPGNWDWGGTKLAAGDFNNDGQADLVVFYGYAVERQTRAFVFTAGGNKFNNPTTWWDSGPGNWDWDGTNLQVGDYNGDGATDLLAFYGYFAQRQARAFVFTAASGNFNAPTVWWDSGPGNWDMAGAKFSSGDFNADGKDDILAFYAYFATHQTKAIVFTAGVNNFTSGFWWDSGPGNWDWAGTKLSVGNFDTNPGNDIAAFYGYGGNQTRIFVFSPNPAGSNFIAPTTWWDSGPGNWNWSATTLLSGNVSGGAALDELLGFYDQGGNTSSIHRFE